MELHPNTPNVIPGKASFTLDVRHPDGNPLEKACESLMEIVRDEARKRGVDVSTERWMNVSPIGMDAGLTGMIEDICLDQGLSYRRIPSGAGHDAQIFASHCKTAMVFVPSRQGISHSRWNTRSRGIWRKAFRC